MTIGKSKKSRFQPIFDYMDEHFAKIEADMAILKKQMDSVIVHMDQSERRWAANNKRWEQNDRRFSQQMELLQNQHRRISILEAKN